MRPYWKFNNKKQEKKLPLYKWCLPISGNIFCLFYFFISCWHDQWIKEPRSTINSWLIGKHTLRPSNIVSVCLAYRDGLCLKKLYNHPPILNCQIVIRLHLVFRFRQFHSLPITIQEWSNSIKWWGHSRQISFDCNWWFNLFDYQ